MRSTRALRIALLGVFLAIALCTGAGAATTIHFQSEDRAALKVQLDHHEVHALTFHPTPAPGHIHVSMNNGSHFTVVYVASEQPHLLSLARAYGAPYTIATVKSKPAASTHHTLRYIAGGIVIVVIVVVVTVLLVDRRRKLRDGEDTPPPTQSQPSQ